MPLIYCNYCKDNFKVQEDEAYTQCPECGTEFKLKDSQEVEMDSFEGDQKESDLERNK